MQITLAIDIRKEKVVKAYAGFRLNYKNLILNKQDFSNPFRIIDCIIHNYGIKQVYIADLDSISKKGSNYRLIIKILDYYKQTKFLIDMGFNYPIEVFNYDNELRKYKLQNFSFVLGTETLRNYRIKDFLIKKDFYFSIDFNGYERQWLLKVKKEKIKLNLILMFLKKVGGRGVDFNLINKYKDVLVNNNCYIAGGVKYDFDIKKLKLLGASGVIVSSFIHRRIIRDKLIIPNKF